MSLSRWRPKHLGFSHLAASLLLLLGSGANSTTLDQIDGTSDSIGPLTFNWTKAEETPSGSVDLSQIELVLVSDALGFGFDLVFQPGALAAHDDGPRDIKLVFDVTSTTAIDTVSNYLTATASGQASISVSELIIPAPGVDLGVIVHGQFAIPAVTGSLPAPLNELSITKNIVASGLPSGSAEAIRLEQRYTVVPEPGTAAMLLLGLAGLSIARRTLARD